MPATGDLRTFIGASYQVVPLKRWQTRLRNRLKPWLIRLPRRSMAYRIDVADGRRYKLIRGSRTSMRAMRVIPDTARRLEGYEHAPKLVWLGETELLLEFIEGTMPDVTSSSFAERLGPAYAALHRMDAGSLGRDEVIAQYSEHVRQLVTEGLLPSSAPSAFERRLATELPESVATGMVSNDPKADNIIVDPTGKLFMIDLGAFQPGRPIDCILAGSAFFEKIDRETFERSYLAAGGEPFLFEGRDALVLIEFARHSERNLKLLHGGLSIDRRRHDVFRKEIEKMVGRFEAMLES